MQMQACTVLSITPPTPTNLDICLSIAAVAVRKAQRSGTNGQAPLLQSQPLVCRQAGRRVGRQQPTFTFETSKRCNHLSLFLSYTLIHQATKVQHGAAAE
jgi:hypothetical protein